jgi:hypothetical protein
MEKPGHLLSGIDYFGTFQEFDEWFSSENACLDYIAKLRWPKGFTCPSCGINSEKPSLMGRGLFLCRECEQQTSITAGTLFHGTHKPLRTWFLAMWFATSQKHGATALGLQRVLGLGSYNTAWSWLHELRRPMLRRGRDELTGAIEVDEPALGRRGESPRSWRLTKGDGCNSGRSSGAWFWPNTYVCYSRWIGYKGIETLDYSDVVMNINASGDPAHVVMPRVHRVASLLDRWWLGIHQGAIRPSHVGYYLDEFTFRFNRRSSRGRGLLFYRLMEQSIDCTPVPRQMIIGGQKQHIVDG